MKTQRNIEYDLEAIEYSNFNTTSTIKVLATCENGYKKFILEFDNKYGGINEHNIQEFLDDADLTEIENWVDETEIGWATAEIQKWCIRKSELGKYYSFSVFTFNDFSIVINCMESDRLSLTGKIISSEILSGLEQVNDFLVSNK